MAEEYKPYSERKDLHQAAPYRSSELTYPGNLRQLLKDAQADASKTLMGIGHGIPSVFVTKLIASTKPDFIFVDAQHAMFNRLELHDICHAAQTHSEGYTHVIVRVPKDDEAMIATALDAGAAGIIIPHVESAEEVKKYISKTFYAPIGHRSFSPWIFTPGMATSLYPNDLANIQTSNNHVCLFPQVESVKGIENVEEIAAVPGIQGLMFGGADYSIDAGLDLGAMASGNPDPRFYEALGKFGAACAKNDLPQLIGANSLDAIPMMIQSGVRIMYVHIDVWAFTQGCAKSLEEARAHAKKFEGNAIPVGQPKPE